MIVYHFAYDLRAYGVTSSDFGTTLLAFVSRIDRELVHGARGVSLVLPSARTRPPPLLAAHCGHRRVRARRQRRELTRLPANVHLFRHPSCDRRIVGAGRAARAPPRAALAIGIAVVAQASSGRIRGSILAAVVDRLRDDEARDRGLRSARAVGGRRAWESRRPLADAPPLRALAPLGRAPRWLGGSGGTAFSST
jgi:hypothetical protein